MALVLSLLLAGVGYVIYRNLTESVNLVFEELIEGQEVRVGDISFPKPGLMRVDGLKFRDPDGEGHWLDVSEVEIEYDLEVLKKKRRVKSLRLERPVIHFDYGVMEGLKKTGIVNGKKKIPPGASKEMDLGILAKYADEILVEDGQAIIEWPGIPRISFSFDSDLEGLRPDDGKDSKWVSSTPLKLSLGEINVGSTEAPVTVEKIDVEVLLSRDAKMIEIKRLDIQRPDVKITPQWLADFSVSNPSKEGGKENKASPSSQAESVAGDSSPRDLTIVLGNLLIKGGEFSVSGFDGQAGAKMLPDVFFETSVDWSGIVFDDGGVQSESPLSLKLENVQVDGSLEGEGQPTLLNVVEVEASFLPQGVLKENRLEDLVVRRPELRLSSKNMARIKGVEDNTKGKLDASDSPDSLKPDSGKKDPRATKVFLIGNISVEDGQFFMANMASEILPEVESGYSAKFRELMIGGEGGAVSSVEQQSIQLSELKVNGGEQGGEDSLVTVPSAALDFQIDEVLKEGVVDRLEIRSPNLVVNDGNLSRWFGGDENQASNEGDAKKKLQEDGPTEEGLDTKDKKIWRVRDLKVTQGSVVTHLEKAVKGVPWLKGDFEIQTLPFEFTADKKQMQEPQYRLSFSGIRVRPHHSVIADSETSDESQALERGEISRRDVAYIRDLIVDVTPTGLQKEKRIESVVVSGGEVKLDDEFQALLGEEKESLKKDADDGSDKTEPEVLDAKRDEVSPNEKTESGWRVGEFGVNRTIIKLEAMIPQLEGVQFSIETSMQDVPLTTAGLASRHQLQQVEIAGIELRDPYEGFRTAAILKTIFLKFSLGGLMRQEVESVDILGPVLYVGEPLFNWIDYQRKYRQQNEGTSLGPEEWADDANKNKNATAAKGAWKLKKINAHYGKMIIAPIGTPIGIVPFPFEVETNLEDGQIALNLEIPEEQYVYSLPDLKLDLFGLRGNVEFNVPIEQKDNNLVQTFQLDRLVWKQFDAEKIFVSVTYDANGIYGKLGGHAYEGYVNGEFNVYLKDIGKWDGWLAASNVNMGPITQAIAPENFLMEGKVSGKLVSNGNGLILGTTTGDLKADTPGRIEITKLESVLEALPDEWTQLKRSLTEMALNGLKTFDYDSAQGKIDLVRRDGEFDLDLRGPAGSRVFHFYLHDWRKNKDKVNKKESVVSSQ